MSPYRRQTRPGPGAITAAIIVIACSLLLLLGCQREPGKRLSIVTSTAMIETVVREIAGNRVQVRALVPEGMRPEHFEPEPGQVQEIEKADLFLYHGWEAWLPKIVEAAGPDLHAIRIEAEGDWMVPDVHIQAVHQVTELLVSFQPRNRRLYEEGALRYENAVLREMQNSCRILREFQATPVMCSEFQSDFLSWAGFDILAIYGHTGYLSPQDRERMIDIGRRHRVRLVVDDQQSGPDMGEGMAKEIGAGHVILIDFPIQGSYLEALRSNVQALQEALKS